MLATLVLMGMCLQISFNIFIQISLSLLELSLHFYSYTSIETRRGRTYVRGIVSGGHGGKRGRGRIGVDFGLLHASFSA